MFDGRKVLAIAGIVAVVAAGSACSGSSASTASSLATKVDHPLTLTPAQLLAATGGATPVAFGAPANGKLTYGPAGTMVYTPNKWFSGTDQFQVTTTDAVKLYAVDTPPLATVGGVDIQSSANGSAIAAVPGKTDEIYGMTDRGPDVDGRTDTENVLPIPDFHPQIAGFQLTDGTATPGKTIILKGPDGEQLVGLVDPQANTGESLVTIDGRRELSLRSPNQGMEGLTITPDGSTLVGIMQSALKTPGLEGSAKSVPLARIVTVNMATKAVKEYLYPLANPAETKVALSEITALSDTQFLVDERDGELQPLWQQEDLHR